MPTQDFNYQLVDPTKPGPPLSNDEKVWWLKEQVKQNRVIQHICVRRGEFEVVFTADLGSILKWPQAHGINFPALGCYSVGEANEIAHELRQSKAPEQKAPSLIGSKYLEQLEEQHRLVKHQSVSGPTLHIERN